MPAVDGVGKPCAGKPHAPFEVAGAAAATACPGAPGHGRPTGKPAASRPWVLPSLIIRYSSSRPDPVFHRVTTAGQPTTAPGCA